MDVLRAERNAPGRPGGSGAPSRPSSSTLASSHTRINLDRRERRAGEHKAGNATPRLVSCFSALTASRSGEDEAVAEIWNAEHGQMVRSAEASLRLDESKVAQKQTGSQSVPKEPLSLAQILVAGEKKRVEVFHPEEDPLHTHTHTPLGKR